MPAAAVEGKKCSYSVIKYKKVRICITDFKKSTSEIRMDGVMGTMSLSDLKLSIGKGWIFGRKMSSNHSFCDTKCQCE